MINLLGQKKVVIRRRVDSVTYDNGYPTEGTWRSGVISGSVQPAPATALKMLSEGDRLRDPKCLYTKADVRVGDIVIVVDNEYEIVEVADWHDFNLAASHRRAIMLRIER